MATEDSVDDDSVNYARWEKAFGRLKSPFDDFIHRETSSGFLLMSCTIVALALANSHFAHWYEFVRDMPIALRAGDIVVEHTIREWVNDGFMGLFFLLVGLEIKREILVGELSSLKQAALPIVGAIGGMVVPALVYLAINGGGAGHNGWGIPMATDIAFAAGILVLLGAKIPRAALTFLVALAIADDLGAVTVIAIFYTSHVDTQALAMVGLFLWIMVAMNCSGIRNPVPYFAVGACLWIAMFASGVHATVAGVLAALTIPCRAKYDEVRFSATVSSLIDQFKGESLSGPGVVHSETKRSILRSLERGVHHVQSPLQRLEYLMHVPIAFFVLPLFAFMNAGIPLDVDALVEVPTNPIAMGVLLGLLVGKPLGIAGLSWVAIRFGWVQLPVGMSMRHLIGVSFLGGVGFTMSIFISELAFRGMPEALLAAKTGVLIGSLAAGVFGYLWLLGVFHPKDKSVVELPPEEAHSATS